MQIKIQITQADVFHFPKQDIRHPSNIFGGKPVHATTFQKSKTLQNYPLHLTNFRALLQGGSFRSLIDYPCRSFKILHPFTCKIYHFTPSVLITLLFREPLFPPALPSSSPWHDLHILPHSRPTL
ncbi:hypothetical protein CEXT_368861 [Caerostris extrusa]|uniref:Uncharacterized protein n=1 Tax=Caerostris extrusa TaxID=172846 RepID=A0AAV4P8Z0_CAEEX|nr:hypothetical protein CEXT_368861 [Caerostris extrusa]